MTIIEICVKCSDMFSATLVENGKVIGRTYQGYVPLPFSSNDTDYVELKIDNKTGKIVNWKKLNDDQIQELFLI